MPPTPRTRGPRRTKVAPDQLLEAAQAAIRKYGSGCTGSRFLNGTLKVHEQLEEELADFLVLLAIMILIIRGEFLQVQDQ